MRTQRQHREPGGDVAVLAEGNHGVRVARSEAIARRFHELSSRTLLSGSPS
jgi:hypothetical protein